MVVWPKGNMLTFARVGRSGLVTRREITPPTQLHIPRYFDDLKLAWDGRRLLLLWSETQPGGCSFQGLATSGDEFVIVRRVNNLSAALFIDANGPALRITNTRPLFQVSLTADIAWDGVHYVMGMRYHDARGWFVGITRLDHRGNFIGGYREIATLPSESRYRLALQPSIAAGRSTVVIVIQEVDSTGGRARIYSEDEMLLTDPPEPPRRRSARK